MLDVRRAVAVAAVALVVGLAPVRAADESSGPGFVDPQRLVDAVGEDHVKLRINIPSSLIRPLANAGDDPDLKSALSGLESIRAVILDLGQVDRAARARKAARELESDLRGQHWQELAYVQEENSTVRVMTKSDDKDRILGLVVLVLDTSDDEPTLVFANLTGMIDLAKLQKIGEGFNVPGLSDLELKKK